MRALVLNRNTFLLVQTLHITVITIFLVQQESEVKYRTAAMFTLHQINAYEEDGFLVMDMCCGDNGEIIGDFTLENLRRKSGEEMDKVLCYSENILGFPE